MFNGKIHYVDWVILNSYFDITRGYMFFSSVGGISLISNKVVQICIPGGFCHRASSKRFLQIQWSKLLPLHVGCLEGVDLPPVNCNVSKLVFPLTNMIFSTS